MTETLIRPVPLYESTPYDPSEDNGEVVAGEIIDSSSSTMPEATSDTREVSPTGSKLVRAANRINTLLETRVVNKAHGEALRENKLHDAVKQDEAYASYESNVERSNDIDQAYAIDDIYNKNAARSERLEASKERVKKFGRNALSRLQNAALISLGLGIMGAEAGYKGAKKGVEATKSGTKAFGEKAGDGMMAAGRKLENGMDSFANSVTSVKENVSDNREARKQAATRKAEKAATQKRERHENKMKNKNEKAQAKQDRVNEAKERAEKRMNEAIARKQARRDKWSARRDALVDGAKYAGTTVKINAEFAKAAVIDVSKDQKEKVGRLGKRAKATAESAIEAASETWKNYPAA